MWESNFAKEHINLRLLWLRFLRKAWLVLIGAVAGALLCGGLRYVTKITVNGGRTYEATSIYYVDYAEGAPEMGYGYTNYYTWGEIIHTDSFVDFIVEQSGGTVSRQEVLDYTTANTDSDWRYLYTRSTGTDQNKARVIAANMEKRLSTFAEERKEINSITLEQASGDLKDITTLNMGRFFGWGAFGGALLAVCILLFVLIADTAVFLPITLEERYGVPCLGAESMPELKQTCEKFLAGAKEVLVIPGETEGGKPEITLPTEATLVPMASPLSGEAGSIDSTGHIVVAVKAGIKNGMQTERCIEQLKRLGCEHIFTLLIEEDEKLIRSYYRK